MASGFGLASAPDGPGQEQTEIEPSTPWVAASDGNLNLVQHSLMELNLPVTTSDDNGFTLLHAASSYAQQPVMEWLIQQNVNVNAKDNDGDTPLHHCDDVDAARILVETGEADVTIKNEEGNTARMAKEEELADGNLQEEDSDEEEDREKIQALVAYLTSMEE
eukprot:scaffold53145_cov50-Attheya_sp.AAC.1